MKIISAVIMFLIIALSNPVSSQTTESSDTLVKYLTPMEYAFMMHEPTSWMVKTGVLSGTNRWGSFFTVAYEKRIAPSFTLNLAADFGTTRYKYGKSVQLSIESRWYYRLNKRIREKKTTRNMSDNYLAIGISSIFYFSNDEKESNIYSLYTKWGLQRRFLKHWYIDFGIKTGLGVTSFNNPTPYFVFSTFTNVGVAFTKDKFKLNKEKLCPVLRCYAADDYIFKTNLNGVLFFSSYYNRRTLSVEPNLSFEKKIGKSPFSINTELKAFYHLFEFPDGDQNITQYTTLGANILLEGRWYYNLRRRILKGKSGNGLSANYITIGGTYKFIHEVGDIGLNYFVPSVYLATGWQRLFSKHLYIDVKLGIGYQFETKYTDASIIWPLQIGVGYRF